MKTLVIAAHPDDEVLGCGGTIRRMADQNQEIEIAIFGEGITSRYGQRDQTDPSLIENLHSCSEQVRHLLGACKLHQFHLPDNRFDSLPLLEIVKKVETLIEKVQPKVIFTHHPGDLNIDHVILHRAVLTATRPANHHVVQEIYAFEIPSSTEWAFHQFEPRFQPNVFYDITSTLQYKLEAMELYESEIRKYPHPRSEEMLKIIAQKWGGMVGINAAEPFELIRSIRNELK